MIRINAGWYGLTLEESQVLEGIFNELLEEVLSGDAKHGPHPGPKRAKGTLLNEMRELFTEIDAEDGTPQTIREEMKQVGAMVVKALRDGYPCQK